MLGSFMLDSWYESVRQKSVENQRAKFGANPNEKTAEDVVGPCPIDVRPSAETARCLSYHGHKLDRRYAERALRDRSEGYQIHTYEQAVKDDAWDRKNGRGIYSPECRDYCIQTMGVDPLVTPIDPVGVAGAEKLRQEMEEEYNELFPSQESGESEDSSEPSESSDTRMQSYIFSVDVPGIGSADFKRCDGLSLVAEIFERSEGGNNTSTGKFMGTGNYGNIVLYKALSPISNELLSWLQGNLISKKGIQKLSFSLIMKDMQNTEICRWNIYGAMPVHWDLPVGGRCKKGGFSTPLEEKFEIAIDRYEVIKA